MVRPVPIITPSSAAPSVDRPLLSGAEVARASTQGIADLGQGVSIAADQLGQLSNRIEVAQKRRATIDAAKSLADARLHWTQHLQERQDNLDGDPTGYTKGVLSDFDEYMAAQIEASPEFARDDVELGLKELRNRIVGKSQAFEATRRVSYATDMLGAAIDQDRNALLSDPTFLDEALINSEAAIEASGLPANIQAEMKRQAKQGLVVASIQGQLRQNPAQVMADLESGKWDNAITPEQKFSLLKAAAPAYGVQMADEAWSGAQMDGALQAAVAQGNAQLAAEIIMPSLIWQESRGKTNAQSPKGAAGLAQIMPGTARILAKQMGISALEGKSDAQVQAWLKANPEQNQAMGTEYLRQQLDKYDGNIVMALAAYNAGPGRVDEWISRYGDPRTGEITSGQWAAAIPFRETRDYVRIIMGRMGKNGAMARVQEISDPVAKRAAEARIRERQAEDKIRSEQYMVGFDDELASLRAGNLPDAESKFTESALKAQLGMMAGQEAWDMKVRAQRDGEIFNMIKIASPDEIAEMRAELAAQTEDPAGFKDAAARLSAFDQLLSQRNKRIAEDPADYAASTFLTVQAAMTSAENGGMDPIAYAEAQLAAQEQIGIPAYRRRILSKAQAAGVVLALNNAPTENVGQELNALSEQWGEDFDLVLMSLAEAGLKDGDYIAAIYRDQPGLSQEIVAATRAGDKELAEGLDQELVSDTKIDLDVALEEYRKAFERGGRPESAAIEFNKLARAMESYVVLQLRGGEADPVGLAIERFMESKFLDPIDYSGVHALIPRQVGDLIMSEAQVVDAAASFLTRDRLKEFDPLAIGPDTSFVGEEATLRTAMNSGVWVTSPSGDGLMLMVPDQYGALLPLINETGDTYTLLFEEIAAHEVGSTLGDIPPGPAFR